MLPALLVSRQILVLNAIELGGKVDFVNQYLQEARQHNKAQLDVALRLKARRQEELQCMQDEVHENRRKAQCDRARTLETEGRLETLKQKHKEHVQELRRQLSACHDDIALLRGSLALRCGEAARAEGRLAEVMADQVDENLEVGTSPASLVGSPSLTPLDPPAVGKGLAGDQRSGEGGAERCGRGRQGKYTEGHVEEPDHIGMPGVVTAMLVADATPRAVNAGGGFSASCSQPECSSGNCGVQVGTSNVGSDEVCELDGPGCSSGACGLHGGSLHEALAWHVEHPEATLTKQPSRSD